MTGYQHKLKARYSFITEEGFARLEQMGRRKIFHEPPESGNVGDDIYQDAVYGGEADPDLPQEFVVYSVDWLDEEEQELAEGAAERAQGRPERGDLEAHFDGAFSGWVYQQDRDTLYALRQRRDRSR